jgi:hypothetical protein
MPWSGAARDGGAKHGYLFFAVMRRVVAGMALSKSLGPRSVRLCCRRINRDESLSAPD